MVDFILNNQELFKWCVCLLVLIIHLMIVHIMILSVLFYRDFGDGLLVCVYYLLFIAVLCYFWYSVLNNGSGVFSDVFKGVQLCVRRVVV